MFRKLIQSGLNLIFRFARIWIYPVISLVDLAEKVDKAKMTAEERDSGFLKQSSLLSNIIMVPVVLWFLPIFPIVAPATILDELFFKPLS